MSNHTEAEVLFGCLLFPLILVCAIVIWPLKAISGKWAHIGRNWMEEGV